MPPRSDASASGGEGAQNLSLLQYAFTVILTSHRVDGSIESTRRRGAFDSIAPLRRVDCLYADSILLQIESIDCSYRLDRLDLEFIQRVSLTACLTPPAVRGARRWRGGQQVEGVRGRNNTGEGASGAQAALPHTSAGQGTTKLPSRLTLVFAQHSA